MTEQEKIWFIKLSADHANDARTFAKPEYRGIWNSVIDKYSDNAHFVYELLQNADDAGATEASFTLFYGVGIYFEHNGTRHFTISNPDTSEEDQRNGRLGCVNAISAIGQSAKIVEEGVGNQIGKFGIGFKSVFRYTDTPKIYDDNIQFELRDRIVPCLIDDLPNLRKPGQTLFVLPFRRQSDAQALSKEIEDSILKLRSPLLFLNNLKCISCQSIKGEVQRGRSVYRKEEFADEVVVLPNRENVQTRKVRITAECGDTTNTEDIQIMSRKNSDGRAYAVGFKVDANGRPIPTQQSTKAFCYFQTDVDTWLHFYVHASFGLVDNRQGLVDNLYNRGVVNKLAVLAADAVLVFKKLGVLDDSIFQLFPCELIRKNRVRMFEYFELPFVALINEEAIFRTDNGYTNLKHAQWAGSREVLKLLPTDIMRDLCGNAYEWVFTEHSADLKDDVTCDIKKWIPETESLSLAKVVNALTPDFVKRRGFNWVNDLYGLILKNHSLTESAKIAPIIFDANGNVTSAKNGKGEIAVYLPIEIEWEFPTVHPELLKQSNAEAFFQRVGLRRPSRMDAIKKIIVDKIPKVKVCDEWNEYCRLVKQVLVCYLESKWDDREKLIQSMKECPFLLVREFGGRAYSVAAAKQNLYFPNEDFEVYFKGFAARCVERDLLVDLVGKENGSEIDALLKKLGVNDIVKEIQVRGAPGINHCCGNLDKFGSLPVEEQKVLSHVMWRLLCCFIERNCHKVGFVKKMSCGYPVSPSETLKRLRTNRWLFDLKGRIVSPSEIYREDIPNEYEHTSRQALQLMDALQMKRNPELVAIETLTEENRAALKLGQQLCAAGFDKKVGVGVSVEKLGLLLQLEEKFTEEDIKGLLNGGTKVAPKADSDNAGDVESLIVDGAKRTEAVVAVADNRMSGLSADERHAALLEAKKLAAQKLMQEGFEFKQGICEDNCSTINGVMKDGIEYPLVVHSYIDKSRPFQLTTEDWCQLLKPNAKLLVRTSEGICSVPFRDLVCNRERIDFSFSTKGNLDSKNRLEELAHIMRWFKGFHFDFGSLVPMEVGTAKMFDLPENQLSEEDKVAQMKPDDEQEVL